LSALLKNVTLSSERDRWWWILDPNGIFSVKLTRQWIDNVVLPKAQLSACWNNLVPRKVNILIWCVLLDRIPTRLNLHNRGLDIPDILCPICNLHTEHTTHLFFGCEVANSTWAAIGVWIELLPVGVQLVAGIFSWLDSLNFNSRKKNLIEVVFFPTICMLWGSEKIRLLETRKLVKIELSSLLKRFLSYGYQLVKKKYVSNWVNWLKNPSLLL
jgi:hypothetical protein